MPSDADRLRNALFDSDAESLMEHGEYEKAAAAILAALDGWTLVPRLDPESPDEWVAPGVWQGEVLRYDAEITRLREALKDAIDQLQVHPNGFHHCRWCSGVDRHDATCAWVDRNERIATIREIALAALARLDGAS